MRGALGEPQARRRARAAVLSRRRAKTSEPKSAAWPTVQRATSGGGPAASVRSFQAALLISNLVDLGPVSVLPARRIPQKANEPQTPLAVQ